MSSRARNLLVLAFAAAVFFCGIATLPLQEPDEGRYADIAASMARDGDWLTPHLDGIRYFEKPPLFFWLAAAAVKAFGPTEWAVRLPSALAALAAAGTVLALGMRAFGPATGRLATLVFASAPLVAVLAHVCLVDVVLLACLTGALAALHAALVERPPGEQPRRLFVLAFYALAGLATVCKGPIGAAIPAVTIAAYVAATRDWRGLWGLLRPDGPLLYLLVAAPWFVTMSLANPGFAREFFLEQNVARFATGGRFLRDEPDWYYLAVVPATFFPWTLALFSVVRRALATGLRPAAEDRRGRSRVFFLAAFVAPFLLLTIAQSKLAYYALPLFPPLALLTADALAREEDPAAAARPSRAYSRVFAALGAVALVCAATGFAASRLAPDRTYELFYDPTDRPEKRELRMERIEALLAVSRAGVGPVLALALGAAAAGVVAARHGAARGAVALAGGLGIAAMAAPHAAAPAAHAFSERETAEAIRRVARPDDVLVFYVAYFRSIPFYLGRTVMLYEARHVEFGHKPPPEELRGRALVDIVSTGEAEGARAREAARELIAGPRRVLFIVENAKYLRQLEEVAPGLPLFEVARAGARRIISNRPAPER